MRNAILAFGRLPLMDVTNRRQSLCKFRYLQMPQLLRILFLLSLLFSASVVLLQIGLLVLLGELKKIRKLKTSITN